MSEIKKKRGRKPKNYYLNLENNITNTNDVNTNDVNTNDANTSDANISNMDINVSDDNNINLEGSNIPNNNNINLEGDNIIIKKKRGRKPKNYVPTEEELKKKEEVKEPKKRGRKPKEKTLEEENVIKTFKKRGRKPKDKIIDFIPKEEKEKKNIQNENIILQIPYTMDKILTDNNIDNIYKEQNIENNIYQYNPKLDIPEPFNPYIGSYNNDFCNYETTKSDTNNIGNMGLDKFNEKQNNNINKMDNVINNLNINSSINSSINSCNTVNDINHSINIGNSINDINDKNEINNLYNDDKKKLTLLFKEFCCHKNNENSYPEKTDISCWWCCYNFNTIPVSLPYKYYNNKFYTYGIFCSFNCACSYNFQTDDYNMYERYGLLNLLYKKISKSDKLIKIKMSSPREILRKFGGYLSIEEFRKNNLSNQKIYKVNLPPIITILPSIEEKSDNFKNTLKEINDYKLKRSKPLIIKNNTLESFIKGSE